MTTSIPGVLKWFTSIILGTLWCYIEPTIPFDAICLFAIVLDCISAWRLNRRVKHAYPNGGADGKFKSTHASQMIGDLLVVFGCITLAFHVDKTLFPYQTFYLGQSVAAIFCFVELWSVLENESSCSDKEWAKLLQRYVVDKTERHLKISLEEYRNRIEEEDERRKAEDKRLKTKEKRQRTKRQTKTE